MKYFTHYKNTTIVTKALFAKALLLLSLLAVSPTQTFAATCTSAGSLIDVTLPTGSRWDMCWELNDKEGVIFKDISFTTPQGMSRRVMKEASLSQIHVALDDGTSRFNAVTDLANGGGLGVAGNIHDLQATDCETGTLHASNGTDALCQVTKRRGYAYKEREIQKQGYALHLFSRATINASTYVVRWVFSDDGSIQPGVGLTGLIPKIGTDDKYGWNLGEANRVGVSSNNSYYWRLDFDIGTSNTNEGVEEFDVTPTSARTRKALSILELDIEAGRNINEDLKRSWRIVDATTNTQGRNVSYHFEPVHTAHRYTGIAGAQPWAKNDFYVTAYNACERHAVDNPTTNGCGADVSEFTNGESLVGKDLVLWYKLNYHSVPRSEDEPELEIHWDSFIVMPRDWTANNPLVFENTFNASFYSMLNRVVNAPLALAKPVNQSIVGGV